MESSRQNSIIAFIIFIVGGIMGYEGIWIGNLMAGAALVWGIARG